jgi:Fe-S cluster assembly protein SufB
VSDTSVESLVNREYQAGFVTDIESDTLPPGLDESVVRFISERKKSPTGCSSGA